MHSSQAFVEEAPSRDVVNALFHMRQEHLPISRESLANKLGKTILQLNAVLSRDYNLQTLYKECKTTDEAA